MQSRAMSLVEAAANVVVGYGAAIATQVVVFPWFGLSATLAGNLMIGAVFTAVSLVRSYALRRLFERLRPREATA
jgi:membrane protein implicated in regulation of membrane protease activity